MLLFWPSGSRIRNGSENVSFSHTPLITFLQTIELFLSVLEKDGCETLCVSASVSASVNVRAALVLSSTAIL